MTSEEIVARVKQLREDRLRAAGKPVPGPKPVKNSPATNRTLFWGLTLASITGLAIMTVACVAERPTALLPLFFFGFTMIAGLALFWRVVCRGDQELYKDARVRWFVSSALWVAVVFAAGAILVLLSAALRSWVITVHL